MSNLFYDSRIERKNIVFQKSCHGFVIAVFLSIILLSLICQSSKAQTQSDQTKDLSPVSGHENHKVSLEYAASLTKNFRMASNTTASGVLGEFFGKDALIQTLNQKDCVGLRMYYGKKDDGTPALVLVGVDKIGNDLSQGIVLEDGLSCPPICGEQNPLTGTEDQNSLSENEIVVHPKNN